MLEMLEIKIEELFVTAPERRLVGEWTIEQSMVDEHIIYLKPDSVKELTGEETDGYYAHYWVHAKTGHQFDFR